MKVGVTSIRLAPGVYLRIHHYAPPYTDEEARTAEETRQRDVLEGTA